MKNITLAPAIEHLINHNDFTGLNEFCASHNATDIADSLSVMNPIEIWAVLSHIEPSIRVEIFSNLDDETQEFLAQSIKRQELAQIINDMSSDERVDFIKRLPEDKQENLLPALAQAERDDIRKLASYKEGTAGSVMTSDYSTLSPDLSVSEALAKLRREAPDKETIYYSYIVDEKRRLLGFVSLKNLILSKPNAKIKDIMTRDVIFARTREDQEEAARRISKYDLIALPVIDENDALVGIITHDDAIDIITQEHTEDMEKLMAIAGSHEAGVYLRTPSWEHFKNRSVWIVSLAAVGLLSGMIIHRFEATLMHFVILAMYMPMLADTGGNTGSQAATVVVRALALKEITAKDYLKVLYKEFKIALMLSLVLGVISWLKIMYLSQGATIPSGYSLGLIGIAIATALACQVITSTVIGAILPLIASRLRLDPAIVASPALTTVVDITGLLIYFSITSAILGI